MVACAPAGADLLVRVIVLVNYTHTAKHADAASMCFWRKEPTERKQRNTAAEAHTNIKAAMFFFNPQKQACRLTPKETTYIQYKMS
jgi:hypothetical protein